MTAGPKVEKSGDSEEEPARRRPSSRRVETLPPIEERVTFLIHRINALLAKLCNPIWRPYGVDLISSRILVILLEHKEIGIGDIVELMVLPQPTVSHQITRLEKQGFLKRSRLDSDNRSVSVKLTPSGTKVAVELNKLSAFVYSAITKNIPSSELEQLRGQLQFVFEELKDFDADKVK